MPAASGNDRLQSRLEQQKEQATDNAKRIQYISAAASTLRVRTDDLLQAHDGDQLPFEAAEATLEKIRALIDELRPTAEIASEFRKKWDKQKQALTEQRETEIERYLMQESEAVSLRAEAACEQELAAMKAASEQQAEQQIQELNEGHESSLRRAVKHWRDSVDGADQVRQITIDETLRGAMLRLSHWTGDEEGYLMESWEEDLSKTVAEVHQLDAESFAAMENMHKARCSVMESTLQRQQRELLSFRNEYQEQLADVANKVLNLPQDSGENFFKDEGGKGAKNRRPFYKPPAPSTTPKALDKLMQRRISVAKAEASAASDAHARAAVDKLASFAMKEQEHLLAFQMALEKVDPQLKQQLEEDLSSMAKEATEAAEVAREAEARAEARATAQRSSGAQQNHSTLGDRLTGSTAARQRNNRASVMSNHSGTPGIAPSQTMARRESSEKDRKAQRNTSGYPQRNTSGSGSSAGNGVQASADRTKLRSQGGLTEEESSIDVGSPRSPILDDESHTHTERGDECSSFGSSADSAEREEELNRMHRKHEIHRAQQKLKATQEAVMKADWVEGRKDIVEVAEQGALTIKAAEEALEAQARVLKVPSLNDPKGVSNAASRLMKHSEEYATTIRNDFVRVRNMKVALCRARAGYAREAQQQHNFEVLEFEDEVLPAISRLAHETETAVEVGHALKRGVERIPICVISGAWRRAIVACFPVLKHLWDGAHVEKAEREQFVAKLFDTMLRAPGATQQFESQTMSAQVPPTLRGTM